MKCPFLKDTVVRTCDLSPVRKMIPTSSISEESQRCSTPEFKSCPVAEDQFEGQSALSSCPHLCESMVQHCAAQSTTQFIPYNNDLLSRCNSDAHRYCTLYLQRAYPGSDSGAQPPNGGHQEIGGGRMAETIPATPARLQFSRNHMWLDIAPDGTCHVGVDAFLARVLGQVDSATFLPDAEERRPSVILNINGTDLRLTFPRRLNITGCNYRLRSHPETLTEDPYGNGWLFEGQVSKCEANSEGAGEEMLSGDKARRWIEDEMDRLSDFVHSRLSRPNQTDEVLVADGGVAAPQLAQNLDRDELLQLFNLFFTLR
jgi:glycine cleavage system H lipoate-binding protein